MTIPNENSNFWQWAEFYSESWGASVIPLRIGKIPAVQWREFQTKLPTESQLRGWFGGTKEIWGMALVCGVVSDNLIRLDFDDPKDYGTLRGVMPLSAPAFRSQRKGGGYGVILKADEPMSKLPGGSFPEFPRLELMGEGCITVVPPTPGYEWLGPPGKPPVVNIGNILAGLGYRQKTSEAGKPLDEEDELHDLLDGTSEGCRDDALVRITNILRSRNLRLGAIKDVIRPHFESWPWREHEMTWGEAEAKIEQTYERYRHEGARYGERTESPTPEFEDVEMRLFGERPKTREEPYLVKGLVMGGDMANVAMAASSGLGKTTICLGIAICMARGIPVWGMLDVPRPLRVVFIDQEEVRSQIVETADKIAKVYGKPDPDNLILLSGRGGSYDIVNPKSLERLEQRLDRIRPDFVFLDGWQWFVHNQVSDRDVVGPALAWWKRIRSRHGCGTWIIHHTKKIGAPQFRPADPLELASGAKLLMDQARTKLIFEHLTGDYEDYGFLQGRCGRSEWNPIRVVLEYDQTTQSHRMIGHEEGGLLFDADVIQMIWGEKAEIRKVKGLLNFLNRSGHSDARLADFLGVARSSVSKWRTSAQPSQERLAQLEQLAAELGWGEATKRASPRQQSGNKQATSPGFEFGEMPSPIGLPINKIVMNNGASHDTCPLPEADLGKEGTPFEQYREKPGPNCGKCPLRDQPLVGGRGGTVGCTMVVGDGPGQTDAKDGRAYSGRTGQRLEKALRAAKIDPNLCRYTNAVACHVSKSRAPVKKALECCRPLLESELAELEPRMVITLGETALAAFYPGRLRDYHGLRIEGDRYTLVPMYKPDAGDKSPELLRAFTDDFYRLKDRPKMRRLEGDYRRAESFTPASARAAIDTETTGLALTSEIVGVGMCDTPGDAVFMSKAAGIDCLRGRSPEIIVMQNAKFDLGIFESNGLPMDTFKDVDDSMLLAYVMNRKPLGLKGLVLQELNLEMRFFKDVLGGKATFADVEEEDATQYGCADPDATLRLWNHLWKSASARERKLYRDVEKPLPAILAKMQLNGVLVDTPYLEALGAEMESDLAKLLLDMGLKYGLGVETLNSPQKLSRYLYQELKLPVLDRTDSGAPSTEHGTLEKLKGSHPVLNDLTEYRRLAKLKSTFVDGILARQRDGLIYPEFNQVGTVTSRMSSSNPNMQNLPKRTDKTIRKAITAPSGCVVVSLDNSQIDLRVLAYESKDPELMKIFGQDLDVHEQTAVAIYGESDTDKRRTAKTANFLVIFGGGPGTLAVKAGISKDAAIRFMDAYWLKYAGVKRWIENTHKSALENMFVETLYGMRRYIPKLYTGRRSEALREAQNAPIQGGSSGVLKLQMTAAAPVATPFAQIHDELDFYLPVRGLDEMIREIKRRMEGVDCPFKLRVDVNVGPNLGEMKKWESGA